MTTNTGNYREALRSIRPALWAVALLSAAVNLLMLTGPVYMLQVYDRVLSSGSVETLLGLLVVVVILYTFMGLYDFLRARLLSRAAHRLDMQMSARAFGGWLRPQAMISGQPLRDLDILRGFMTGPALALFDLPWIPIYVAIVFAIHPWLGMLTLGGAFVVAGAALLNQRTTQRGLTLSMRMEGGEREFADQSRQSGEALTALGMQERAMMRWLGMHLTRLGTGQVSDERAQGFSAFSKTFRMFLQSALLSMAAYLTIQQEISAGMIIASSIIAGRALAPVDQAIGQWRSILRAREAHRSMLENFGRSETEPAHLKLPTPAGALRVVGVTRLQPGPGPLASRGRILEGVTFMLEPGDGLGVIGASASGKSTLARLLVGAIHPDAGEIRLDGAPFDQWEPEELGRHIGYLPQRVDLLPGTVRDNIARFDPEAKDADIVATAKLAGVHDMILRLPDGYRTMIGRGSEVPLSGGQVQRLGLARALYGNPKLIVLDEPNSNLDQVGDTMLTATMAEMRRRGSTVIVMAHRSGAIAAVNKILYLKEGRIVAFGPKEEVLGQVVKMNAPPTSTAVVAAPTRPPLVLGADDAATGGGD